MTIAVIGAQWEVGVMRRVRSAMLMAILVLASSADATSSPGQCFWVTGRLSAYNGAPTFRIWPTGTKRLLGVVARSGAVEREALLPAEVRKLDPSFERTVWGRFHVCPLTPDRPGRMRFVVVTQGRDLRVSGGH